MHWLQLRSEACPIQRILEHPCCCQIIAGLHNALSVAVLHSAAPLLATRNQHSINAVQNPVLRRHLLCASKPYEQAPDEMKQSYRFVLPQTRALLSTSHWCSAGPNCMVQASLQEGFCGPLSSFPRSTTTPTTHHSSWVTTLSR